MNIPVLNITSMLVLIIARPKCTLTASHAAPGTVRQTDRRQNVTLRLPLDTVAAVDGARRGQYGYVSR